MGGAGAGDRSGRGGAGAHPVAPADALTPQDPHLPRVGDLDGTLRDGGSRSSRERWLPAVERVLGGPARVLARRPLSGGYVAAAVERIDLDVDGRAVTVVLKAASPAEVAAMRAVAVVGGVARPLAVGPDWIVTPYVDAPPLADGQPVPDAVWDTLARVHTHWHRKRPRGIPVVDGPWWAALCDRTLVAVRGGLARTGDPAFAAAATALESWRDDPRILRALATLPRTLCHGDPHRGNILGKTLIDWGNARVAPAGLDLAVLRAQGAKVPPGHPETVGERDWAGVHVNVQYMGFAADHLGPERVAEMMATAADALARLPP